MKKIFLFSALMATFCLSTAQELQTYSVYDTNQSGDISVGDVAGVADKVVQNVSADKTQQYVTAEDFRAVLQEIDTKLANLAQLSKLDALEADVAVIKEKVNYMTPDENGILTRGHEYVDLGIRDSSGKTIYWATCNVGADSPQNYGDYFAWGETSTKKTYDWSNYKYCNGSENTMTKYCTNSKYGTVDDKTVLDPEDDAATANWGGSWRMPTNEEYLLLIDQCYWQWVESYNGKNVNGYVVYKAKAAADKGKHPHRIFTEINTPTPEATYSITSDAHIFLPASGERDGSSLSGGDKSGSYWSRSVDTYFPNEAYSLFIRADDVTTSWFFLKIYRYCGRTVRPVCQ